MTELLAGSFPSLLGRFPFDQMPDQPDEQGRQQHHYYHNDIPLLPAWQQSHTDQMSSAQDFFAQDTHSYPPYSGGFPTSIPHAYHHDSWASDMDMGTPSPAGFPNESADYFQKPLQPFGHLRIPANSASAHSPQSSNSGVSPQMSSVRLQPERPHYGRSLTDPGQKSLRATAPAAPCVKQQSSDEEDEDISLATEETSKSGGKGKKRQRIPHTAVERRYRENLNAHLDKLRQTVPSLAARKGAGKEGDGGVKPSKCEILSGAIDHIGAINRENEALKNEVRALRQQVGEYEAWHRR